jgi:hypothetical protein
MDKVERGSARIFSIEPHDHEKLAQALGVARSTYQVKWWWKYGQPAIDLIKASLEVQNEHVGPAVAGLMKMNGPEVQVTAACFPYGIPTPDVFRIDVEIASKVG